MVSFVIGNTTIYLWPFIIWFVIILIGLIIRTFFLVRELRCLTKSCQTGQYDKVIEGANRILRYYERTYRLVKTKQVKHTINTLHIYLSISYYGIAQHDLFLKHIGMVEDSYPEKYFWFALYHLVANDMNAFEKAHAMLTSQNVSPNYLLYLNAIKLYKDGNCAEAEEIIQQISPKLNFVILKDIFCEL